MTLQLRYAGPARTWTDALPIGNGRLGAMCFGGVALDRLQVNDATGWSGAPGAVAEPVGGDGPASLAAARAAMAAGDLAAAHDAVRGLQSGFTQAYQPLVDLVIASAASGADGADESRTVRGLDLGSALAWHAWPGGRQEAFVSAPAGVLALERVTERPDDVVISLTSPHPCRVELVGSAGLTATVDLPCHVVPGRPEHPYLVCREHEAHARAVVALRIVTDGEAEVRDGAIHLRGATRLRVLLATETDARPDGDRPALHGDTVALASRAGARVEAAAVVDHERLRAEHEADHRALFDRVSLDLGPAPAEAFTDDRLRAVAEGGQDPALAALAFQLGRYLMIAGSRPGTEPLTLQGIWNAETTPPWSSNYTININTQMNYWPAFTANLAECALPLLEWAERLAVTGAAVARDLYGAPGWVAHHNSDLWGFAAPVGRGYDEPAWSFWPLGGVWLARQLLDGPEFDPEAADRARVWAVVSGAVEFALWWLVEDEYGVLGTAPGTSPENLWRDAAGRSWALTTSPTSDIELLRDLFDGVLTVAADVAEGDVLARVRDAVDRLPPTRVLADGRVAEWPAVGGAGVPDVDPQHRHQSHLIGLFPGRSITPQTPELFAAAGVSLRDRGVESTGWSLAWRLALAARLGDPDLVRAFVERFLRPVDLPGVHGGGDAASGKHDGGVYRSLLCAHPPFQIDGNFGFTAGVVEALLQSHRVSDREGATAGAIVLDVLPACPWPTGRVRGLRGRGGVVVDLAWGEEGDVRVTVTATSPARVEVRRGDTRVPLALAAGASADVTLSATATS